MTKWLEWLSDRATKWLSDQVIKWPSDQVTKWPIDRIVYFTAIFSIHCLLFSLGTVSRVPDPGRWWCYDCYVKWTPPTTAPLRCPVSLLWWRWWRGPLNLNHSEPTEQHWAMLPPIPRYHPHPDSDANTETRQAATLPYKDLKHKLGNRERARLLH